MLKKLSVRIEKMKAARQAKDKLEENARRYIAIKNSIKRYEKDGSEYSLNHISKLEKRLETVKGEIRFWNDKLQIAKKK